jgi:CRISPR/Cas system-associated exonuclease Cas4 (RecB family)
MNLSLKKLAQMNKKETKDNSRTVEELFLGSIDDFLMTRAKEKDDPKKKRKAHNPSGYYKCWRAKYYELLDFPSSQQKYVAKMQRVFDVGTITHEWIQDQILSKMSERTDSPVKLIPKEEMPTYGAEGITFTAEHNSSPIEIKFLDYRHTKLFPISAMIDGAFNFMSKDILFEFKTINSKDFEFLIEPLLDHRKQGAMYVTSLGIKLVMFVYINKDNQLMKAYLVEYTNEQVEWVISRMTTLEGYVERKELPPKEVSMQCNYCAFKYQCDNEVNKIKELT